MPAKLPLLVSEQEDPMEIIGNVKYGYYFKNNDATCCTHEIEKIMNELKYEMVSKAYQRIIS